MDGVVKAEPVVSAVPEPAAPLDDPNERTDSETEEETDSEDYLDEIIAKIHELLMLRKLHYAAKKNLSCSGRCDV